MKHTCMSPEDIAWRVECINKGGGHCFGLKWDKLGKDRLASEESCKACQQEKVRKQR